MRVLYHFIRSPFSRRTRLALAHKTLDAELREARSNPAFLEEARALSPRRTMPVLVEEDGRALGDSTAISHYLDRAYPSAAPLWPAGREDAALLFQTSSLVDGALNPLVDFGTRLHALRSHEAWPELKGEALRRSQGALDKLETLTAGLGRPTIAASGWSAADIWLYTAIEWLEGLPARAEAFPLAAQVLALGYRIPDGLARWADAHRDRPDVKALSA
jgi:glutathione S-transferase